MLDPPGGAPLDRRDQTMDALHFLPAEPAPAGDEAPTAVAIGTSGIYSTEICTSSLRSFRVR